MMRALARWLYRIFATITIVMALVAIAVSQLLPLAERHPEVIVRWLSERAGLEVTVDRLSHGWTKRGPLLQLEGLRIGEGEDAVRVEQAEILIAQYTGLLPGRSFSELRLRGLHLTLERLDDGRWQVRGIPGQAAGGHDPLSALGRLGELQVMHAQLGIIAPALGIDTTLPDVDLRLRVDGARAQVALSARMRADTVPLRGVLDLDRKTGNASAHAAIAHTDLALWSPLLRLDGLMLSSGEGQIVAWVELQAFRLSALTTSANFDHLVLQRVAADDSEDAVAFGQVEAQLFWRNHQGGQWQLHAPHLRIGDPASPQILDGLMLAGGPRLALNAARIDAGPLLAIAALSPRLPAGVRDWLKTAKPDASAHDIQLSGSAEGGLRGHLRLENLHFASVEDTPGVTGLGGAITLDMHGAMLELEPTTAVEFNWPSGFGVPHHLKLDGTLSAWWTGRQGVHLMTPALRVDADGYAADVRGGMWFHGDGRRPRIDVVAALDATQIPVAKRFWMRSQMSKEAIEWLDMALVSGKLLQAQALVSGELADWPFDARDGAHVRGIFEAQGELAGARLRFEQEWPVMDDFNGPIRFFNDGFSLSGKARLSAITLSEVKAALPHYGQSNLSVHSRASGDMHDWLSLLRQSPLHADHSEVLDNLAASGPATSTFAMTLPLGGGRGPTIQGEMALDGVNLSEQRWALEFSDVRGPVSYSHNGFASGALSATQNGHMGILNLRAGTGHVHEASHAFEAELQMELAAAELIRRVPNLNWLAPHLHGSARWTAALAIKAGNAAPGELRVHSDLVGTALTLPAPLDKPAHSALATEVKTAIPWDEGDIEVRLGQRMAVHARPHAGQTGLAIALGQADIPAPAPAGGVVISGRAAVLDASAWASLGRLPGPGADAPTLTQAPPPVLNLDIGQLHLLGADFANVRLNTAPGANSVQIESPAISGRVHWPATPDAALKAELTRLYWPPLVRAPGPDPADAPAASANATDPRQLPPLDIHVSDLRLGEALLGAANLRTQRTASGLEIEHFRIEGAQQTLTARGAWSGTNGDAKTHVELDVDSRDLGQLFLGLGLGQQLKGGIGSLHLAGHWPGSPMGFASVQLTGAMNVNLRDGQLLEVDPGAGRVLGLLSVAQLPRRLLLDFRDFFGKGFGFNEISGQIQVEDGIARTHALRINGPAAKIRISGSSNLVAQTHDQSIEVSPRTGNLLTAVGAVAGGPLGAAVGAAASAVLKSPLSEVGAKTYRVSGAWNEPQVEVATAAMMVMDTPEAAPDESEKTDTSPEITPTQNPPPPAALPQQAH